MPTAEQIERKSAFQEEIGLELEAIKKFYEGRENRFKLPKAAGGYLFDPFDDVFVVPENPDIETRVADLEKQVAELKPKQSLILSPTQSEIEFFSKGTLCR